MKIKNDFVTNSSSTSYTMWGLELEIDEFLEKLSPEKFNEFLESSEIEIQDFENAKTDNDNNYILDLINDYFWSIESKESYQGPKTQSGVYFEESLIYVGVYPTEMKLDETLKQFKDRVIETLKQFGLENLTPDDIQFIDEEVWN